MTNLQGSRTARSSRSMRSTTADDIGGRPRRSDWKRLLLVAGLGILSWISTYMGMLELVQANMGKVDLMLKIALGMSVAMLMLMIIWLLDQIFSPIGSAVKMLFIGGYVFLSLISVGFGFGFYWKFLESRSEASRSAESAVSQVQSSLHGAETRLSQLLTTLDTLTAISTQKAADEVAKGNSCPNSRPGDGPRRRLREADATRFSFASQFVKSRIGEVKAEVAALDTDLARVVMKDGSTFGSDGTRNEFLRGLGRKLDTAVTGFNAFRTDPQLRQFRADFADRAEKATFSDEQGGTFSCPDAQLQTALRGVVKAIDQLPVLEKPEIAAVEGAEATIEAFRRLTATLSGLVQFKLPPSADQIRAEQQRAIQSQDKAGEASRLGEVSAGLGKRDWIPLMIAVFVDLCLLLVSFSRPINRFQALVPKMREAQEWPVIEILSKFHGIHEDETIRRTFEVLRHVVFSWRGVYYAAIPLNGGGNSDSEAAQLEAYLLSNLFTSFERERIFRPVPVSMFTTAYIQRKLSQQRSKYADVEGFRIYKFNDGAWPEMILGAVMGAAKRVEAEQVRLEEVRLEAEAEAQKDIVRTEAARQIAEAEAATEKAKTESARLKAEADAIRHAAKSKRRGVWPFGRGGGDGRAEPSLGMAGATIVEAATLNGKGMNGIHATTATAGGPPPGAAAAADAAYDVTRLVGEFTMLMKEQKAVIERQAAAIEELNRTRQQEPEPQRPRQPEIRVVEGGANGGERPVRTYFRTTEAPIARPASYSGRRDSLVEALNREPASVTPIHSPRSTPPTIAPELADPAPAALDTAAQLESDVAPVRPSSPENGSLIGWALNGLRGRSGEAAKGLAALGRRPAKERVEPALPALATEAGHEPALSGGPPTLAGHQPVSGRREASPAVIQLPFQAAASEDGDMPTISSDEEIERFIAVVDGAAATSIADEEEHAPEVDGGDDPAEYDADDDRSPDVEELPLHALDHPVMPLSEEVDDHDDGWEELEDADVAADARDASEDLGDDEEPRMHEGDSSDWNQPDIDHDSITKWWAQGRDKGRR